MEDETLDDEDTVAVVIRAGAGKSRGMSIHVDDKRMGVVPSMIQVAPGKHDFMFRGEDVEVNCTVMVPDSGKTIEVDAKKEACK